MFAKISVTDNHMHIDSRARGLEAVKEFQNSGGTHIILVTKPSWSIGVTIKKPDDYITVFDETIEIGSKIKKIGGSGFSGAWSSSS